MNEVWNLDPIYRGFDDPAFARDLEKLEGLTQAYADFAAELSGQEPLEGLREGSRLE